MKCLPSPGIDEIDGGPDVPPGPNARHQTTDRARFGRFELNVRTGELLCAVGGGETAPRKTLLREQPFQILRLLIEHQGDIVSREEIKRKLWPRDTIVDFDRSINVAMAILRRALEDSAEEPEYIETLARRGYRLRVPVEWQKDSGGVSTQERDADLSAAPFAPSEIGSLVGKRILRYRVLEILGAGGMGLVYRAEDLKLGRNVALKFLPEEFAGDASALRRFEREAQTASALNHPNICTIYGIEEYQANPFIVMEFLEGETLAKRLGRIQSNPIEISALLGIATQVCDGLQAAHAKGIIHRDIKPANIFLTTHGPVKILDFGLAKLAEPEERANGCIEEDRLHPSIASEQESTARLSRAGTLDLTLTGTAFGTLGYMSPEQIRKEKLDARTDLFSLGVVLFEMATGHRAFDGATTVIVQEAIIRQEPGPARDLNPSIPHSLNAIIAKALEKERARRYQSAAELRAALLRVREAKSPAKRSAWILSGTFALLLALVFAAAAYFRTRVILNPNDTLVRADFDNETGDAAFSDGLNLALQIALEQTPYLNLLSTDKIRETMAALSLPANAQLTADVAARVCKQTQSRAVIAGSISDAGNRYHVELRAFDCGTGKPLADVANFAENRDEVVRVLGISAFQLRAKLGEPKRSLDEFNKPLEGATSSSPDALHFLAQAYMHHLGGNLPAAISDYDQAIEKDPSLALAYSGKGSAYWALSEDNDSTEKALARAALRVAFEARDRLTAPGRFEVETQMYADVTEQPDEVCAVAEPWVKTFPHAVIARVNFSVCLNNLGRFDDALVQSREAARLLPRSPMFANWMIDAIQTNRLDEADTAYNNAVALKVDSPRIHQFHAIACNLQGDQAALRQEWKWDLDNPTARLEILFLQPLFEADYGHFHNARRLYQHYFDVARKTGALQTVPAQEVVEAYNDVEVGDSAGSEKLAAEVLTHDPQKPDLTDDAMIFARVGNIEEARKLLQRISQRFPEDQEFRNFCVPAVEAAIKMQQSDPAAAVELLRPIEPYELTAFDCYGGLYEAYIRGMAYLELKDGRSAALQFQKLIDHPGIVRGSIVGPLANVQLARAETLMGDRDAARKSYGNFLSLWKDADPDIPIYKEAKAEYAQLAGKH